MNGVFLERSNFTDSFGPTWQQSVRTIVDTDFAKSSLKPLILSEVIQFEILNLTFVILILICYLIL
jgi:hypothetical protein